MVNNKKLFYKTKKNIADALQTAERPVCLWSSGKDSMLLLYLIREVKNIPVIFFKDFIDDMSFLEQVVKDWDLTVFFYKPVDVAFNEQTKSLITQYNIAQNAMPLITDVLKSDVCGVDWVEKVIEPTPQPYYSWDLTFAGSKASDTHSLITQLDFAQFNTDTHCFVTPLWDWTDGEVLEAIDEFDIPIDRRIYMDKNELADTGNISLCLECKTHQEQVWCPKTGQMIQGLGV